MTTLYIRHSQKEHTCIGIHYVYISGNVGHSYQFAVALCAQNGTYILTGMPFSNFILYVYETDKKAIPLQPWTDPEGSRRLRLPDFKTLGTSRW